MPRKVKKKPTVKRKTSKLKTARETVKQILAWSYSRLSSYRRCPRMAKFKIIDKLKTEQNSAMKKGSDVHEYLHDVARGPKAIAAQKQRRELTEGLRWAVNELHEAILAGEEYDCEVQWGFDKTWKAAEWFGDNCRVRLVVDLAVYAEDRALLVDYKTGRMRKQEHLEQLSLYALAAFCRYPKLKRVQVEVWYTDHEKKIEEVFVRRQLTDLKRYWRGETTGMLKDKTFAPTPGRHCTWCDFSNNKGGQCEY